MPHLMEGKWGNAMLPDEVAQMLTGTLIPFWEKLRDDRFGGYCGFVDFDLNADRKAEKGCVLNSRILWFFASAARFLKRDDLLPYAMHAYTFLREHCLDPEHGGVYWSVAYDGSPADTAKHTYNQAFAIYALSAYYEACGDPEALSLARSLYRLVEARCTDEFGYLEAFDRSFRPASNEKLSENGVLAEKTMNTLLHVFEGYSGLYRACGDKEVGESLRRILGIFTDRVYSPEKRRQEVFFDREMNSILDLHSYGHDIEASWLLDWGCGLLGDRELSERVGKLTSELAGEVYKRAYRKNSLWNECDRGTENKMRIWWVQAEAVLGFLNAFEKEPSHTEYLQAAHGVWDFIREHVADPRPGSEWFWQLDDNLEPDRAKPMVEPWKCPYHNGRMCLELLRRRADASC